MGQIKNIKLHIVTDIKMRQLYVTILLVAIGQIHGRPTESETTPFDINDDATIFTPRCRDPYSPCSCTTAFIHTDLTVGYSCDVEDNRKRAMKGMIPKGTNANKRNHGEIGMGKGMQ